MAQKLIQLPRSLGEHPENGDPITTGLGRYGPFLKRADEYRNLESWERACDITLDEALEILKQPKPKRRGFGAKKTVLKELGEIEGGRRTREGSRWPLRPLRHRRQDQRHSAQRDGSAGSDARASSGDARRQAQRTEEKASSSPLVTTRPGLTSWATPRLRAPPESRQGRSVQPRA